MSRSKPAAVLVLTCLLSWSAAHAQRETGIVSLSGFVGMGMPREPEFIETYYEMGIGIGGAIRYNFSDYFAVDMSLSFQPLKVNTEAFTELALGGGAAPEGTEVEIEDGHINTLILSANLQWFLTSVKSAAGLYLNAGAGYYVYEPTDAIIKITTDGQTIEQTDEAGRIETGVGVSGGAGVELVPSLNLCFFVEGKYHYTFVQFEDTPEGRGENGNTQFITVMGGIRLTF
jgi:hypothetical protein